MNLLKKLVLTGETLLVLAGCFQTRTEYKINSLSEKGIVSKKEKIGIEREPGKIYSIRFMTGKAKLESQDKNIYDRFNEGDCVTISYRQIVETRSVNYGNVKAVLFPDTVLILLDAQKIER